MIVVRTTNRTIQALLLPAAGISRPTMRQACGLSLVEGLVALAVLSVGMLGVAGMLLNSVRASRSALYRTQAVFLASDMADRIRANTSARTAHATSSYSGEPIVQGCAPGPVSGTGGNCSIEALAQDDLARWLQAVSQTLPPPKTGEPAAVVELAPRASMSEPDRYRITVMWQEPGAAVPSRHRTELVLLPRPTG